MALSIDIGGDYSQILRDFADSPKLIQQAYDGRVNAALNVVRRRLSSYPPERPGQRYRRTKRLGNAWSNSPVKRQGPFSRTLENSTPYTEFVQGKRQAGIHQGRWETVDDVLDEGLIDELADEIAADIALRLGGRR